METHFTLNFRGYAPLQGLYLKMNESHLLSIQFVKTGEPVGLVKTYPQSPLYNQVVSQLTEYFAGRLQTFTIPYDMHGSAFKKKVWGVIAEIPYGQTRTYKEVAEAAGGASLARAVGGAANRNPVPVIVPCHRVVGSGGSLTGFAAGVGVKRFLLEHERGISANVRIRCDKNSEKG
jgi:methylated-DNA-[protein]-cysteine S-methyltransferase